MGLGLAIARSLARANAGDLTYRPGEPHGARFEISLPVFRATRHHTTDADPAATPQLAHAPA